MTDIDTPDTPDNPDAPVSDRGLPARAMDLLRRIPPGGALLVAVAYVPLLLTRPGEVGADTKTYLYLDPGRLLSRAAWMWDTNIGLGTVTHQNIGYLWPMGPWYLFWDALGVPDWVAQRLWLGTLIAAAGLGVRFLCKELRWEGAGITVASFAYALSPYLLHYGARISVILLPFAGLPWLVAIASRSLRRGGWRWPSAFALVTLTVGGVNATSLILVMAGPLLWFAHAVWVTREVDLRRALAVGARISVLTLATSLWWMVGLSVQGAYGIPILRYTETYQVVANAALSTELLRGLGYWFFYGRDALGAWIAPAERLVENTAALALSFTVPGLAFVSGVLTRFRHRGYFALLVATGLVIGVGAHPWDGPSPIGAAFRAWTTTDAGLAFRSTPRAMPLIALGLAVMLGAGVAAVSRAAPRWHLPVAGAVLALVCANQWALFGGEMVDRNLRRDENLPEYWLEAAAAMDTDDDTRVLEVPGTDFASYRWGNTVDPVTPGLIDRPFVARELIPYGTPLSADLINALDEPLQSGVVDPTALVPVAQLMGVGTVVHRADLQYERFRTPRPRNVWQHLSAAPGFEEPTSFGDGVPNRAVDELPLDDEVDLAVPPSWPDPPAVSLWDLVDPRPVLRATSASSPTVLAGDGSGVVAWAASGALDPDRPVFYSASFAEDPDLLGGLVAEPGAQLVVTDTNRRAARRWGTVRDTLGYTERAGEEPLEIDRTDNRLELFPGAGDDAATVSEQVPTADGPAATVAASGYANPVSYTPADRAARAMDGDPATAWRVAAFDEPRGEYLQVDLDEPVSPGSVTLLQVQRAANRWITEVELTFDGGDPLVVPLGEESRTPPGQVVDLGGRSFSQLRITITDANVPRLDRYVGVSDVGFAEVVIPGVPPVVEVVRPPVDLLDAVGPDSLDRPLTYLFSRRSADPAEVVVDDDEPTMLRWVEGPAARTFTPFGTARLSPAVPEPVLDDLLGLPTPQEGGVGVTTSARMPGDPRSRGTSAVDGDRDTAWRTPINDPVGQWIEVVSPEEIEFAELALSVVRDGRHSIPTGVTVQVDGGQPVVAEIPEPGVGDPDRDRGEVATFEIPLPPQRGRTVRVTIDAVEEATSRDWFGGSRTVQPVGIVDLGLPVDVAAPSDDDPFDSGCRDDLVELAGAPVALRATGTVGDALDRSPLQLSACGDAVDLPAGRSLLRTAPGGTTGLDVDRLALASAAGGAPGRDTLVEGPEPAPAPPATTVAQPGRLTWELSVEEAGDEPYWVVLGQSHSPGFRATTADGTDLGPSVPVNGYANGWYVDPAEVGGDGPITITWAPQRLVWASIWLSLLGVLGCVALLVVPVRRWGGSPLGTAPPSTRPTAIAPLSADGPAVTDGRTLAAAGAGLGVAAALLAGPVVGAVTAVAALVGLRTSRGGVALRAAVIGGWAVAAGYVVLRQHRNGWVVDFNWMNQFEFAHAWGLAVVALLVTDVVVSHLRATRGAGSPPDGG